MTHGIYSVAADISVCSGIDSASKNEYQDIPGGKGGRCARVTNLSPSCAECLVIWSLNRPEPSGPHRPVMGIALLLHFTGNRFRRLEGRHRNTHQLFLSSSCDCCVQLCSIFCWFWQASAWHAYGVMPRECTNGVLIILHLCCFCCSISS